MTFSIVLLICQHSMTCPQTIYLGPSRSDTLLLSFFQNFPFRPPRQLWEDMLTFKIPSRGVVSVLCDRIPDLVVHSRSKTRAAWEEEIGLPVDEDWWGAMASKSSTVFSGARLASMQFMIIHRVHLSKLKLSNIIPEVEDKRDRCSNSQCHVFLLLTPT